MALQLQSCAQHRAVKSLLPIAWTSIGWPGRVTNPNRRVRTRTHGGVGGVGPRGLPLSRLSACRCDEQSVAGAQRTLSAPMQFGCDIGKMCVAIAPRTDAPASDGRET